MKKIIINFDNHNQRIDIALSNLTQFSRSMIQKMIYANKIKQQNLSIQKANHIVQENEVYELTPIESNINTIIPEEGHLDILFEDENIIVLNKCAELIVHPGAGNPKGTLINHLANYCKLSNHSGIERLGVIHRLDKGVSGCIVFAKNNEAHIHIANQFANRTVIKKYIAFTSNKPESTIFTCENYINRSKFNRKKMAVYNSETEGKHALMKCELKEIFFSKKHNKFISMIECLPQTGRMHQIRLQLSNINLPIIGDTLYGKTKLIKHNNIALHAKELTFINPTNNKSITIKTCEKNIKKIIMDEFL